LLLEPVFNTHFGPLTCDYEGDPCDENHKVPGRGVAFRSIRAVKNVLISRISA
jgi:hypothetical protein